MVLRQLKTLSGSTLCYRNRIIGKVGVTWSTPVIFNAGSTNFLLLFKTQFGVFKSKFENVCNNQFVSMLSFNIGLISSSDQYLLWLRNNLRIKKITTESKAEDLDSCFFCKRQNNRANTMRLVYHIVFNCFSSSCSRFANCLLFNDSRWHLNRYCRVSFLYGRTKTRLDASWGNPWFQFAKKKDSRHPLFAN